jgi:hypothetical protein
LKGEELEGSDEERGVDAEDRHLPVRFLEVERRRINQGLGENTRRPLDRRARRRERVVMIEEKFQPTYKDSERTKDSLLTLPLYTLLTPAKYPKDYIGVVLMDMIMAELVLILDDYAMKLFYACNGNNVNKSNNKNQNMSNRKEKDFNNMNSMNDNMIENKNTEKNDNILENTCLISTALKIIKTIVKSNFRKVLVPMVFRILIGHCGLRVKAIAKDALLKQDLSCVSNNSILLDSLKYMLALEKAYEDLFSQIFEDIDIDLQGNSDGTGGNGTENRESSGRVGDNGGIVDTDECRVLAAGYDHLRKKLRSTVRSLGVGSLVDSFLETACRVEVDHKLSNSTPIGGYDTDYGLKSALKSHILLTNSKLTKGSINTRKLLRLLIQYASIHTSTLLENLWRQVIIDWVIELCSPNSSPFIRTPAPLTLSAPALAGPKVSLSPRITPKGVTPVLGILAYIQLYVYIIHFFLHIFYVILFRDYSCYIQPINRTYKFSSVVDNSYISHAISYLRSFNNSYS